MTLEDLKGSRDVFLKFQTEPVGVYVFISKSKNSAYPEFDYLLNDITSAIDFCIVDIGLPEDIVRSFLT